MVTIPILLDADGVLSGDDADAGYAQSSPLKEIEVNNVSIKIIGKRCLKIEYAYQSNRIGEKCLKSKLESCRV